MKTALYFLLSLLVLTVTGSVLVVTYDVHQDLRDAHQNLSSLNQVLGQASATAKHLDQTVVNVDAVVGTLNDAATEERDSWKKTSKETAKTALDVRELVDDFRKSALHLNLVTMPALDSQITSNGDQLRATIGKLGETSDELTVTFASLNRRLGDPRIDALESHLESISVNLDQTTASGAHVAKFYEDKLTKAKGIAQTVGGGAWKLALAFVEGHYF